MHCLVFTDTDLYSLTKGKSYLAKQKWRRSTCLRDQCYDVGCHPCKRDAVNFKVLVSSNFRCLFLPPYWIVSLCFSYFLKFTHLNGVQLSSITIFLFRQGRIYSTRLRKNALAFVLNRNYGIIICQFYY